MNGLIQTVKMFIITAELSGDCDSVTLSGLRPCISPKPSRMESSRASRQFSITAGGLWAAI